MEQQFGDDSFFYYLIDNVEKSLTQTENDLTTYLKEIEEKSMKKYLKTLKSDLNNKKAFNVLKNFTSKFKMEENNIQEESKETSKMANQIDNLKESNIFTKKSNQSQVIEEVLHDEAEKPLDFKSNEENPIEVVKLCEISSSSKAEGQSQKLLEIFVSKRKLPDQINSKTSNHLVMKELSKKSIGGNQLISDQQNVNFEFISLPDNDALCGSWRMMIDQYSPIYSNKDILEKKFKSERVIQIHHSQNNNETEEENSKRDLYDSLILKKKKEKLPPIKLKLIAIDNENEDNMTFIVENDNKDQMILSNQTHVNFFQDILSEMIQTPNKRKKDFIDSQFSLKFKPEEAMIVLNENFKFEEFSEEIFEEEEEKRANSKNSGMFRNSLRAQSIGKGSLPGLDRKGTKLFWNQLGDGRKSTHKWSKSGSMFGIINAQRGSNKPSETDSLNINIKEETESEEEMEGGKFSDQFSVYSESQDEGNDTPINSNPFSREVSQKKLEINKNVTNKTNQKPINEEEEDSEEEDDSGEKDIRVKFKIEIKREIWMSLRTGPILSYVDQIKYMIEHLGFEIKFIEDLDKIVDDKEQFIKEKIDLEKKMKIREKATGRHSIMKSLTKQNSKTIFGNDFLNAFKKDPEKSKRSLSVRDSVVNDYVNDWDNLPDDYNRVSFFDIEKHLHEGTVKSLNYTRFDENNPLQNETKDANEIQEIHGINQQSNIMKYHNLLMETSQNSQEYLKQFMAENPQPTVDTQTSDKIQQSASVSYNRPNSTMQGPFSVGRKPTSEFQFQSEFTSTISKNSSIRTSKQFRTNSEVEREKDYNKFFTYLEGKNDELDYDDPNYGEEQSALFPIRNSSVNVVRDRKIQRLSKSQIEDLREKEVNEISNQIKKAEKKKKKDIRELTRKLKYVVLLTNTNERFLETTFYLLGVEKKLQKQLGAKFGYSIIVFPRKNYIFKSISYSQPKNIRKPLKEVHSLNFEFLPMEKNVISLGLEDILRDIFVKNDKFVFQYLAETLYKINLIFGKVNDYVYKGSLAQKVVEIFLKKTWESEICEEKNENNFHEIRDWALKEFIGEEDPEEEEMKEIEKEYVVDQNYLQQNNQTNLKVTQSYLIPIPRDSKGNVVVQELESLNKQPKDLFANQKRASFFNRTFVPRTFGTNNTKRSSNMNATDSMNRGSLEFNTRNTFENIQKKYGVEKEIIEESKIQSEEESHTENSYDSHSDSGVFDPNKENFSEQSIHTNNFDLNDMIHNFDFMVVMDRANDLVTPFVSQSSYFGILDDLLKIRLNHVFVKGALIGVQPTDIDEEIVIPLSRPQQVQNKSNLNMNQISQKNIEEMNLGVSMKSIPKRSFLNPPLLQNSNFKFEDNLSPKGGSTKKSPNNFLKSSQSIQINIQGDDETNDQQPKSEFHVPMSSQVSINIMKMDGPSKPDYENIKLNESVSVDSLEPLNESMSILDCSFNRDTKYIENNPQLQIADKSPTPKDGSHMGIPSLNKDYTEEQKIDYLVNLTKLIYVRENQFKSKFAKWKEMNFYKVTLELEKEFQNIVNIENTLKMIEKREEQDDNSSDNQQRLSQNNVTQMFDNFKIFKNTIGSQKRKMNSSSRKEFKASDRIMMQRSKEISEKHIDKNALIEEIDETPELNTQKSSVQIGQDLESIKESMEKNNKGFLFSNFAKLYEASQSQTNIPIEPKIEPQSVKTISSKSKNTKSVSAYIKRMLQIHYNFIFAISNYCKKTFKEGVNQTQENILQGFTNRTFNELIHLIKTKVDFKKIANLICLINFTDHGFKSEQHEEIILKVIQNYPIKYVYTLLKMDSYGFFSKKLDISNVSSFHLNAAKKSLFNPFLKTPETAKNSTKPRFSEGISFTAGSNSLHNRRVTNFMSKSSVSTFMNNIQNEKTKKNVVKESSKKEEETNQSNNLNQFSNSLAVRTYQIENNFFSLKHSLNLLESSCDLWNYYSKSTTNFISPICRYFELLVNEKYRNKISDQFSCLLKAFELKNSKYMASKKEIPQNDPTLFEGKGRKTIGNLIRTDKKALFTRLNMLFNVNKLTGSIMKMLKASSPSHHMKKEINKFLDSKVESSKIDIFIEKLQSPSIKNILLFFIGGLTLNEIYVINRISKKHNKNVFIITTNTINSNSFYNMFKNL